MRPKAPQFTVVPVPQEAGIDPALKVALEPEEAAERLSVGRTMMFQLLGVGAIQSVKIGTKTLIPVIELNAFLARNLGGKVSLTAHFPPPHASEHGDPSRHATRAASTRDAPPKRIKKPDTTGGD